MGDTLKRLFGIVLLIILLSIITITAARKVATDLEEQEIQGSYSAEVIVGEEHHVTVVHDTMQTIQEEIRNEIMYGEIELLAQLIQAEAGNQDNIGKSYVADVVLNRVDSKNFPDKIEDVIFQTDPIQFSCIADGGFDRAAWSISEESFKVALHEYTSVVRLNSKIVYFRTDRFSDSGHPAFQYGDHYFSTE